MLPRAQRCCGTHTRHNGVQPRLRTDDFGPAPGRLLGIPSVLQSASANFLAEPLERPHETYEHYVTLRDSLNPTGHK